MIDSLHLFPSHINYAFDTNVVEPHSFIDLKLNYDPLKANDWGYKTDQGSFKLQAKKSTILLT